MGEWSETRTTFPGGVSLWSRWRRATLPHGLWWIEQEVRCSGKMDGPYAMGAGWIIEFIELKSGSFKFRNGDQLISVPHPRFVFVLPAFSVVHMVSRNAAFRFAAVAGEETVNGPRHTTQSAGSQIFPLEGPLPGNANELLERLDSLRGGIPVEISAHFSPLVRRAKRWLEQKYHEQCSIAQLADSLGISHPHLSREFSRSLGMSPLRYLHHLRSSEALGKLTRGDAITDASLDVGYNDLSRFYKQFRRLGCESPGRYRNIKKRQDREDRRA